MQEVDSLVKVGVRVLVRAERQPLSLERFDQAEVDLGRLVLPRAERQVLEHVRYSALVVLLIDAGRSWWRRRCAAGNIIAFYFTWVRV